MKFVRQLRRVCNLALAGWLIVAATAVAASEKHALDPALAATGWMELAIPGITPARYRAGGAGVLEAESNAGTSIIYRMLTDREQECDLLVWRWQIDKAVPATDPTEAGKDDRDLAIHIWFPDNRDGDLWQALGRAVSSILGLPRIGKVLTYVFGGTGERQRRVVNPHHSPDGAIIVLRPSGTEIGKWFDERIDIAADFKKAFGESPPKPMYLAVSTDSDDTQTQSAGRIADIAFLKHHRL
jgi:hypothetical protein